MTVVRPLSNLRSAKRINALRGSRCHAGDSSHLNLSADHDSAMAHNLHLLFTAWAAHSQSSSLRLNGGKGISSPWGSPARSYPHDAEKMGRWRELRYAVAAVYEHETWQDDGQFSRRGGEGSPGELSENRAP